MTTFRSDEKLFLSVTKSSKISELENVNNGRCVKRLAEKVGGVIKDDIERAQEVVEKRDGFTEFLMFTGPYQSHGDFHQNEGYSVVVVLYFTTIYKHFNRMGKMMTEVGSTIPRVTTFFIYYDPTVSRTK